ncbi:MAG: STAS domain-containing protein [Phycisphaerae bacterium]|nr:STAS domain-containing protein [Phycisphaerae bacterium]
MAADTSRDGVAFDTESGVTVATLGSAEITTMPHAIDLLAPFEQEIQSHRPKKLLIDLRHVAFVSTTAINMLLVVLKRVRTYGGDVYLTNLNAAVRQVFETMRLTEIFQIYPDRQTSLDRITGQA